VVLYPGLHSMERVLYQPMYIKPSFLLLSARLGHMDSSNPVPGLTYYPLSHAAYKNEKENSEFMPVILFVLAGSMNVPCELG